MAHADYNCCLICDSKMEYGGSDTKVKPCTDCLDKMRAIGTIILTVKELKDFVDRVGNDVAVGWLNGVGYEACYYPNEADAFLIEKGIVETDAKDGKWGNKLKKVN